MNFIMFTVIFFFFCERLDLESSCTKKMNLLINLFFLSLVAKFSYTQKKRILMHDVGNEYVTSLSETVKSESPVQ